MPLRDAIDLVREQLGFARHGDARNQQLRLIRDFTKIGFVVDKAVINFLDLGSANRIEQKPRNVIQRVVASGAGHGPITRERFLGAKNFFSYDIQRHRGSVAERRFDLRQKCLFQIIPFQRRRR